MAVLLREQSQVLLAKLESTYGVDSSPTGANALYVRNITVSTDLDKVERNNITGFLGAQGAITTGAAVNIEFEMELAPSGTAGTAPHYASVLKACGMSETFLDTNTNSTNDTVAYAPDDASTASVTIYWQVDGLRHAATGCRGNVTLTLNSQAIPVLKFRFVGRYTAPVSGQAAPSGVDFSTIQSALGVYKDTVPRVSLMGSSVRLKNCEIDVGNNVVLIRNLSDEQALITGRKGKLSVGFHVSDAEYATFVEAARTDATGAFSIQLGTTAGKIVVFEAPNVQLSSSPSVSFEDSVMVMSLEAALVPTSKNNDFVLSFK